MSAKKDVEKEQVEQDAELENSKAEEVEELEPDDLEEVEAEDEAEPESTEADEFVVLDEMVGGLVENYQDLTDDRDALAEQLEAATLKVEQLEAELADYRQNLQKLREKARELIDKIAGLDIES